MWGDKLVSAVYGWTFVDAGDGKFYLQNYGTKEYIEPTEEGYGKNGTRTSKEPKTKYTVKYLGQGAFNIIPEGKNPLHAQKDGTRLVTWEGGLNTASAWHLQEISKEELNSKVGFTSVSVTPGTQTYAAGNKDQVLLSFTAMLSGFVGNVGNANVKLNLNATDFNDLQNIKVYKSNNANFVSNGKRDAVVVGELATPTANEVTIPFNSDYNVPFGGSLYYVTADIKEGAAVGNEVDVEVASITNEDNTLTVNNGNPEGIARIYKVQSVPFMPNDLGTAFWRIPSMVVLHNQKGANASKNGRVVTMADNRFNHGGDLPGHIDVYERHSDDNGKTWSKHKWVVGNPTDEALVASKDGKHKGFGDVTIKLGQSSSTLSGGENQRVKLAYYLGQERSVPTLFIFDEPTTGLHFHDINRLLKAFNALIERGHTIVIIEHNLDVIKCADYMIDLGPEGGREGGQLVACGTPEEVMAQGKGYTAKYLKEALS